MLAFTYVSSFQCQCLNDDVQPASAGLTARVSHGRLGPQRVRCHMPPNEFPTGNFDSLLDHLIPYLVFFLLVTGLGNDHQAVSMQAILWQTDGLLCQACAEQRFSNVTAIRTWAQQNRFEPTPLKGLL